MINHKLNSDQNSTFMYVNEELLISVLKYDINEVLKSLNDAESVTTALIAYHQMKNLEEAETDNPRIAALLKKHYKVEKRDELYILAKK